MYEHTRKTAIYLAAIQGVCEVECCQLIYPTAHSPHPVHSSSALLDVLETIYEERLALPAEVGEHRQEVLNIDDTVRRSASLATDVSRDATALLAKRSQDRQEVLDVNLVVVLGSVTRALLAQCAFDCGRRLLCERARVGFGKKPPVQR